MSVEELERLASLKESGALTEEEFEAKKAEILSGGNKSPEKKKSKLKTVLMIIVGIWGFWLVVGAISKNSAALAELPACDSREAKSTLKEAFDQAQFARTYNLSAIEVSSAKELSSSEESNSCSAKIAMNNAETVMVNYKLEKKSGGKFMLTFEVKE